MESKITAGQNKCQRVKNSMQLQKVSLQIRFALHVLSSEGNYCSQDIFYEFLSVYRCLYSHKNMQADVLFLIFHSSLYTNNTVNIIIQLALPTSL